PPTAIPVPYTTLFRSVHKCSRSRKSPDRHSATHPFAHGNDIGHYIKILEAEKFSRPSKSGLDLIQDEERTYLFTALAYLLEVVIDRKSTRLNSSHVKI